MGTLKNTFRYIFYALLEQKGDFASVNYSLTVDIY